MTDAVALGEQLLKKQEHIDMASRALKAIAHPLRLKILCVLGSEELSVQEIVDCVGTSQSNISQHLAILREKDVLRTRKDSKRVFYRIGDERMLMLIGMMREVFCGADD
jgi:DNA-binding transcriptional ArsR family regulator